MTKTTILHSLIIMSLIIIPCIFIYNKNDNQDTIKNIYSEEHNNKFNSLKNALTIKMSTDTTLKQYENKFTQFMHWIESDLDSKLALMHSLSTAYDLIQTKIPKNTNFDTFVIDAIKCGITTNKNEYNTNNPENINTSYNINNYHNIEKKHQCTIKDTKINSIKSFLRRILIDAFYKNQGADNNDDNETILNTLLHSIQDQSKLLVLDSLLDIH